MQNSEETLILRHQIIEKASDEIMKYDFDRMMYKSFSQLQRAQDMKQAYAAKTRVDIKEGNNLLNK